MAFKLNPPEHILSKLGVQSLDELRKDKTSCTIEALFQPAKKYAGSLHSEKFYIFNNVAHDFYSDKNILTHDVGLYARELLTNAIYHGPQNAHIFLGAYLTLDIKILACNDGGDYFKNPTTKSAWEDKVKLNRTQRHNSGIKDTGYGAGQTFMFNALNELFIDVNQGTIYLIQPVLIPSTQK